METIGNRNDHAEFEKDIKQLKKSFQVLIGNMVFVDPALIRLLFKLEKRIRELELKINQK